MLYIQVNSIENASDVKVEFFSEEFNINNRIIICKVERENNIIKIELEKKIYIYDENKKDFYPSKYEELKNNKV